MKTYILDIIPKIQKFSQRLDDLTVLLDKHWVVLDEENLSASIPVDKQSYEIAINETQYENYKNFFTKSYAESIDMLGETLILKNTYAGPLRFEVTDFGKETALNETINMNDMAEVIFLTKYIGDYNITKYGDTVVLTNEGYNLHLKRI